MSTLKTFESKFNRRYSGLTKKLEAFANQPEVDLQIHLLSCNLNTFLGKLNDLTGFGSSTNIQTSFARYKFWVRLWRHAWLQPRVPWKYCEVIVDYRLWLRLLRFESVFMLFYRLAEIASLRAVLPLLHPTFLYRFSSSYAEEKERLKYLNNISRKIIANAREVRETDLSNRNDTTTEDDDTKPTTLIEKFIDLADKGLMDEQRVLDQVVTFMATVSQTECELANESCFFLFQNLFSGHGHHSIYSFERIASFGDEPNGARSCVRRASCQHSGKRLRWFRHIVQNGIFQSGGEGNNAIAAAGLRYTATDHC